VQFLFYGHPQDLEIDRYEIFISSNQHPGFDEFDILLTEPVHTYQDENGWFHVIGEIQNESKDVINLHLIGTFYNQTGAVLGAATTSPSLRTLNPGERSPYDVKLLNPVETVADWQIQIDPALSRKMATPSTVLTLLEVEKTSSEFQWSFSGSVNNDSQNELKSIVVVAGLRDTQSGNIIGLSQVHLRGEFQPGSPLDFYLPINPDRSFDLSGVEEFILIRGR
jgi:hypothetical protein